MMYGNQAEIGQALTAVFKEGKVKREDVWMTSKVYAGSACCPQHNVRVRRCSNHDSISALRL